MARIHLEVILPGADEPTSMMRFDTKHSGAMILSQITAQRHDQNLQNAKLLLQKPNGECAWVKKAVNLKSLAAKNDMKLIVLRNPFVIHFESATGAEQRGEVAVNPKAKISDILPRFAEALKLPSTCGYSIFPIVNGRELTVNESLSLFIQVPVFEKVVYRIKYYNRRQEDGCGAIALYKAYCQTRDFLLTGSSLLPFKVYIKMCAEVSVIESGENINEYLSQCDTGMFTKFLPKSMQKDSAEDDLFQAVSKTKQDDVMEMRKRVVSHARKNKLFGCLAFDGAVNGEKVNVCVGQDAIYIVKPGKLSISQTLSWDVTAEIEDNDRLVITETGTCDGNDKDICIVGKTCVVVSKSAKEILSAIVGYQEFRKVCETLDHDNSDRDSLPEDDSSTVVSVPRSKAIEESLFARMISGSVRGILALNTAKSGEGDMKKPELTAISALYLVASEVHPDMFGLLFRTDVKELRSEAENMHQTLLQVESQIRCGMTLSELNEKYGNDLRFVSYLLYELETNQMCRYLRQNIDSVYRRVCSELNSKVVVARVIHREGARNVSPKHSLDKLMITVPRIRKELPELRNLEVIKKSKLHTTHIEQMGNLLMNIGLFFFDIVQQTDDMIFPTIRDQLADFHSQVSKWIPVAAAIDRATKAKFCISQELSAVLECIDAISIFTSLFPKVSFSVLDMSCFYVMIARGLESTMSAVSTAQLPRNFTVIARIINDIRNLAPPITCHFVPTETLKTVEGKLILLQYELGTCRTFFEKNGLKKEEYMMRLAVLLGRWGILHISPDVLYDDEKKRRKGKHPQRIVANIKVPKEISNDDSVELSQEMVDALNWETEKDTDFRADSAGQIQMFLKEISEAGETMKDIYELFRKWRVIFPHLDPKSPSFAVAVQEYDFGMDIIKANFQRQRKFQATVLLKRKLLHHTEHLDDEKFSDLKEKLLSFHKSMTGRERDLNVETKGPLDELITEVSAVPEPSSDLESILTILVRLSDFSKDFGTDESFTFVGIIRDLFTAIEELKRIMMALITTQSNVVASKVLQILVVRYLQLNEYYVTFMRTTFNDESKKQMTRRISKVRKGLEGLQIVLTERHLDIDTRTLMMSLSSLRWKIMHLSEESMDGRYDVLANCAARHIDTLKKILEDKDVPSFIESLTNLEEKILASDRQALEIISSLIDLRMLHEQRTELGVESEIVLLRHTVNALIGQLEMKPFAFIFDPEGTCGRAAILQSGSADIAASPRRRLTPSLSMRELSYRLSTVHRSRSNVNMARLMKRPGILLDCKTTQHRLPAGPHVTFQLTSGNSSQLCAGAGERNENVPEEFLPLPVQGPCFQSWNLAVFAQKIKLPQMPVDGYNDSKLPNIDESKMNFRHLKIPAYKEQKVEPFSDEAEAEAEIDAISTQIRSCLSRMANLKFVGLIGERVFWVLDWKDILSTVPAVLSAASSFNLPQIEEAKRDYNAIKIEIDGLVDELQLNDHVGMVTYAKHIEKLFELLAFSLDAAACEVMGKDAGVYGSCRGWLPHFIDARNMFSKLVRSNDTPPIIASRGVINDTLTYVMRFLSDAMLIDKATERNILTITETELAVSIKKLLRKIKKCNVRDNPTTNQIASAIQTLKKDKNIMSLDPQLRPICEDVLVKISNEDLSLADADIASCRISDIISTVKRQHKKADTSALLALEGLRYDIMSLKFSQGIRDFEFTSQIGDVCAGLRNFNASLLQMTDKEGSVYARNLAIPWNDFFVDVIEQFETLLNVADILSPGSRRYKTIFKYLCDVASVLVRLDGRHFPFPTIQIFGQLSRVYQKLEDYVQTQCVEPQIEQEYASSSAKDTIESRLTDIVNIETPKYAITATIPPKEDSDEGQFMVLRTIIKQLARQKFMSLSDLRALNILICESMIQLGTKSKPEEEIRASLKCHFTGTDGPVWKKEFEAMSFLFRVSEFLCELSLQNIAKKKPDFTTASKLWNSIISDEPWNSNWKTSIESQVPLFEKLRDVLNNLDLTTASDLTDPMREDLIAGLTRDVEKLTKPARGHDLVPVIEHIRKFFGGIFYSDDISVIVNRLRCFIEAGQDFAQLFASIPNTSYLHMKLGKRLKLNLVGLVKTAGSPEFHKHWNSISVELEQVACILQIIEDAEMATTESDKFLRLMNQMEKVIQTLFQVKEERSLNMSIVLESVANVLLGLKHTPSLCFRLNLTAEEFRNFVVTAQNVLFANPDTVEESLELLLNAVVPSFSDASSIREAIILISQGYRNRAKL